MKKDNNRSSGSRNDGSPKPYKGGNSGGKKSYSDKKDFGGSKPTGERKFDKKPGYSKGEGSPRPYGDKGKFEGKKDYSDKKEFRGPKPDAERNFDKKPSYSKGEGSSRPYGDKGRFEGKKDYSDKKDFKSYKPDGERNFDKKPGYSKGEGSSRPYGDKGRFEGKKDYSDKKEFRGPKPDGERKFDKKPGYSKGEGSPRPYGDKGRFEGKKDYSDKKPFSKSQGERLERRFGSRSDSPLSSKRSDEFDEFEDFNETSDKKGPRKPRLDEERAARRAESRNDFPKLERRTPDKDEEEFEGIRDLSEKKGPKKSSYEGQFPEKKKESPTESSTEDYKKSDRYSKEDKPAFGKRNAESGLNKKPAAEEEFKSVYRGRGKDEKPIYEKILKSDLPKETGFQKKLRKPFTDDISGQRPNYNFEKLEKNHNPKVQSDSLRLNKFIANSGICSRREADVLIQHGEIQVNGEVIKELGHKVNRTDKVIYRGKNINPEKPVYLLLNKPKDFITTTEDPMDRKTVMHLISNACEERVFPVGRLDRNTTGLLLFTNDGELAAKLSHPSNNVKKIYQVTLNRPLTANDEKEILEGITLEDGPAKVDDMQVLSKDRTIIGLEIHLGRNRIVRRIFAHFDYEVEALDRVIFAGLDKKDLPRGKYRFLSEKEVIQLKYFL
ncbi:pseudouridine synthase [Cognataquiflexum rubidum]|uniref:pseudouridine synthase n=1 Tax=Cognataquiflexum rubidum TaxID=2922273 RepID=UPI003AB998BF